VVRDALRQRRGDPAGPIDAAQVRHLLAVVRARLAEARDSASSAQRCLALAVVSV
jgi:hypothetical protein